MAVICYGFGYGSRCICGHGCKSPIKVDEVRIPVHRID